VCEVLDKKIKIKPETPPAGMGTTVAVGTGGGKEKTRLGSKISQTAHTSHNARLMGVFCV
jgi:hypothetical protein